MRGRLAYGLLVGGDRPLGPAASPDHRILADTRVHQRFVTPAGAGYCRLLNDRAVYPPKCDKPYRNPAYTDIHNFVSSLVWAPDSENVAFVEKVYDWEYDDPYNRDYNGRVTRQRWLLVTVSAEGQARHFDLRGAPGEVELRWDREHVVLNGRAHDLRETLPGRLGQGRSSGVVVTVPELVELVGMVRT